MDATQTNIPDYPRGITFEQVWAAMMEDREENRKRAEESRKVSEEVWKAIRETSRQMGDLHNRFGEMAEHLVAPNIHTRFNEMGYHFGAYYPGGCRIEDENGKTLAEIDILLENKDYLMAIEIKAKPAVKDIEPHIKRLQILRESRDRINDHRKIQGAFAGAIFPSDAKRAVAEAGLFVIEQSGDTMRITVPDGFVPREW